MTLQCSRCKQHGDQYRATSLCIPCAGVYRREWYARNALRLREKRRTRYAQDATIRAKRHVRDRQRNDRIAEAREAARPHDPNGKIYFIEDTVEECIKIGFTRQPLTGWKGRLRQLQCGNSHLLRVVGFLRGTRVDERRIHQRFAGALILNEWFRPVPELRALIATLPSIPDDEKD